MGSLAVAGAVALSSCGGRTDLLLPGSGIPSDGGLSDGSLHDGGPPDGSSSGGGDGGGDALSESTACARSDCTPGSSRSCNQYGTQTCDATCAWGACSCPSPPQCSPSSTQCAGNGVQTCGTCGTWGGTAACPAATPYCSNGACTNPPSCQPGGAGMSNCGPGGRGEQSCCTSPDVTGGTFYRTYPPEDFVSGDADPATVSDYRLDDYLVTVGRFRQFVNAALPPSGGRGWTPAPGSGRHTHLNGGLGLASAGAPPADGGLAYEPGWIASDDADIAPTTDNLTTAPLCADAPTWTSAPGTQENLPINCVNWWEAYAFCIWDGGFLPSETEWLYAAAGGSQQRAYPWGSTDPGNGNQYAIYACNYPTGNPFDCMQNVTAIAPVGTPSLGAGVWGQLDLTGEVWEWTIDWYAPFDSPCTDCADVNGATARVLRGGDWNDTLDRMITPNREGWDAPTDRNSYYGFRCARAP